jgi:hypothetical protein
MTGDIVVGVASTAGVGAAAAGWESPSHGRSMQPARPGGLARAQACGLVDLEWSWRTWCVPRAQQRATLAGHVRNWWRQRCDPATCPVLRTWWRNGGRLVVLGPSGMGW